MNHPLVSVVIPNYNHARFLKERIDSVINQTYKNFEIIILDDNSSDNSTNIIKQYESNPKVSKIVYNIENSGSTFKQWEKGIDLAKGDYIWIAESDDSAFPEFLQTLITQLEQFPNAILAFSHSYLINSESKYLKKDLHKNSGNSIFLHNGKRFASEVLTMGNYIYNASMVVFRRSVYYQIEKESYQQFRSCGDWVFWMNACLHGDVVEVCQKLNCFRQHNDKVTVKAGKTGRDWQEVSCILLYFIDLLQLKGIHKHIFIGKWTNDIHLSKNENKQQTINNNQKVFGGSKIDILLYRLSKLLKIIRNQSLSLLAW